MKNLQEEKGYIFIIVIWVLVILGVIMISMLDNVHLDNYLIENELTEKELYNSGVSAAMLAVNILKNDTTVFDHDSDQWAEPYEETLPGGINCQIEIKDIGSRININYCKDNIFEEIEWWNEDYSSQLEDIISEHYIIPDMLFLKDICGDNYHEFKKLFTTYGNYNINNDSIIGLEKLMKKIAIDEASINELAKGIEKFRDGNNRLEDIEQMPLLIEGLDLILYEKIVKYLGTNPRININLVDQEVLELILKHEGINEETAAKIIEYREDNCFEEIDDLQECISDSGWDKLKDYFTVSSNYFQVKIALSADNKDDLQLIKIFIERRLVEDQWQIKFIRWSGPDVMESDVVEK